MQKNNTDNNTALDRFFVTLDKQRFSIQQLLSLGKVPDGLTYVHVSVHEHSVTYIYHGDISVLWLDDMSLTGRPKVYEMFPEPGWLCDLKKLEERMGRHLLRMEVHPLMGTLTIVSFG